MIFFFYHQKLMPLFLFVLHVFQIKKTIMIFIHVHECIKKTLTIKQNFKQIHLEDLQKLTIFFVVYNG